MYIHGRNSRGGQNLGRNQAAHANEINQKMGGRPFGDLWDWHVHPGLARDFNPHAHYDHGEKRFLFEDVLEIVQEISSRMFCKLSVAS